MAQDLYNTWTYRKIVPMQLIEFILDWADKDGNNESRAQYTPKASSVNNFHVALKYARVEV